MEKAAATGNIIHKTHSNARNHPTKRDPENKNTVQSYNMKYIHMNMLWNSKRT